MKSELTYHFGSYPLCRRRSLSNLNNPGKTQRSLNSTPLMTHCSIDKLLWETSFDPISLNTPARNKTTLCSKYGSSDFEIMVKNMYTKSDGGSSWPTPSPSPLSLSIFHGNRVSSAHGCLVGNQISDFLAAGCGCVIKLWPAECECKNYEQPLPHLFRRKSVELALSPFLLGVLEETSGVTCWMLAGSLNDYVEDSLFLTLNTHLRLNYVRRKTFVIRSLVTTA